MMDERKRSSPWNMDLKKLTDYRARIAQAKPDVISAAATLDNRCLPDC